MELLLTVVLAWLVCFTHGQIYDVFSKDELEECFGTVPNRIAEVKYTDTSTRRTVTINDRNQGVKLPATTTAFAPIVTYAHTPNRDYAIIFICVDDDGCAEKTVVRWYVINIPEGNVDQGETQRPYTAPEASPTESYNCVIIVARQSRKIQGHASGISTLPLVGPAANYLEREHFPDFITDNGLTVTSFSAFKTQKVLPI